MTPEELDNLFAEGAALSEQLRAKGASEELLNQIATFSRKLPSMDKNELMAWKQGPRGQRILKDIHAYMIPEDTQGIDVGMFMPNVEDFSIQGFYDPKTNRLGLIAPTSVVHESEHARQEKARMDYSIRPEDQELIDRIYQYAQEHPEGESIPSNYNLNRRELYATVTNLINKAHRTGNSLDQTKVGAAILGPRTGKDYLARKHQIYDNTYMGIPKVYEGQVPEESFQDKLRKVKQWLTKRGLSRFKD